MLIKQQDSSVLAVTQVEHAALSYRLAKAGLNDASLNSGLLTAIQHHDDGWTEWDRAPCRDDGELRGYRSMILRDHLQILKRSVQRCRTLDPYAGWLASRHACSFHRNKSGDDVESFLCSQRRLQEGLEPRTPPTTERKADFDRLQFVDGVSLFMIDPWSETWTWERIHPGPGRVRRADGRFLIENDAWPAKTMTFEYEGRTIPAGPYPSRDALRRTLEQAPIRSESVVLEGVPGEDSP